MSETGERKAESGNVMTTESESRSLAAMTRDDAELSLLLDEAFAGAVSADAARRLLGQLQSARRAVARLNRRCQQAEAKVAAMVREDDSRRGAEALRGEA
jgi:hypothetical protein